MRVSQTLAQAGALCVERPLDRIESLARQADHIGDTIQDFLNRCRGAEGSCDEGTAECVPGHISNIELLAQRLKLLEQLALELGSIG